MKKICVMMILAVLLLSLPVLANGELFLQGMQAYTEGRYVDAVNLFGQVLQVGDSYIYDALFYKALTHAQLYELEEMEESMAELSRKGYEVAYLHWQLGRLYLNKDGQFDDAQVGEALIELENAHRLGLNTALLHQDLAMAYQGSGEMERAIGEYRLALNADPSLSECYINLAQIYIEQRNYNSAVEALLQALNTGIEKMNVYQLLGDLKTLQKEYATAAEFYKKALGYNQKAAPVLLKLAVTYYHMGSLELARAQFEQVVQVNEYMYEAYYYLGEIAFAAEQYEEALKQYGFAVKYNQKYADAYIALGKVYLAQGNAYRAMSQFTLAIEASPNYADAHYYLATAHVKLESKEAAIAELRKTLHMDPNHAAALQLLESLLKD